MNDSADIENASKRLQSALSLLIKKLDPLLERVSQLETAVNEGKPVSYTHLTLPTIYSV